MKTFSAFDFIKAIIDTKQPWDSFTSEQQKLFNPFMINKSLSMNKEYIDIVNYMQKLNITENKKIYEVYCWMIPQNTKTYFPFIKSNKKIIPEATEYISKKYECSLNEANDYIQMMDKKDIESILIEHGVDDKEIKKLLKEIK